MEKLLTSSKIEFDSLTLITPERDRTQILYKFFLRLGGFWRENKTTTFLTSPLNHATQFLRCRTSAYNLLSRFRGPPSVRRPSLHLCFAQSKAPPAWSVTADQRVIKKTKKVRKQVNTLSTKKATKKKRKENTLSTKKVSKKKEKKTFLFS